MSTTSAAEANTPAKPVTKRRGSYAKTEARRKEILEAAFQVFASNGYRSGSIREVADIVGMSEAGMLHHFPSKVALLEGVLRTRDDHALETVDPAKQTGVEFIRGLITLAEFNSTIPGVVELFCVLSAESTAADHPAHEYFRDRYDWVTRMVSDALTVMQNEGQLRPGIQPTGVAKTFIALMDGLQVQWLLDRDALSMPEELRRYARTFTDEPL